MFVPPTIQILAPDPASAVGVDSVRVSGVAEHPVSVVAISYRLGEGPVIKVPMQSGPRVEFSFMVRGLQTGKHIIEVRAFGSSGLQEHATVTIGVVLPLQPAVLEVWGHGQTGVVGTALPEPIRVQVLDAEERPMQGVLVVWHPGGQNDGSISSDSSVTDANGEIEVSWTLGTRAGRQTLRIRVGRLPIREVTADAVPDEPHGVSIRQQMLEVAPGQMAWLSASVRDQWDNAIPVQVASATWASSDTLVFTIEGTWATGRAPGRGWAVASYQSLRDSIPVEVLPASLIEPWGPRTFRSVPGAEVELRVRVLARNGVPVRGIEVGFAVSPGSGRLIASGAVTDRRGIAGTTLVLGNDEEQSILVSGEGLEPLEFMAATTHQPLRWRQVSAGPHSCGITVEDELYCWGGVADPKTPNATVPRVRSASLRFLSVSGGFGFSCAVTTTGDGYCWGTSEPEPEPVAGAHTFAAITAFGSACGRTQDDRLLCWGSNFYGQLGNGTTRSSSVPVPLSGDHAFAQADMGMRHACGVTRSAEAVCWGWGEHGQLGHAGTGGNGGLPIVVYGGLRFETVGAGGYFSCGIVEGGQLYCWGYGGQLGNGTQQGSLVPVPSGGDLRFQSLTVGDWHACGITAGDNRAYCWGVGTGGRLGNGTEEHAYVPVAVAGDLRFSMLSAGYGHTCGVTEDGGAYCWGDGRSGRLGQGVELALVPVRVLEP